MSGQDALSPLIQSLPKVYAQDDPELIQIIKQKYLIPPSDGDYNIHAEQDTSMGQAQTVRKILNNKVSIFFYLRSFNKGCLLTFTYTYFVPNFPIFLIGFLSYSPAQTEAGELYQ